MANYPKTFTPGEVDELCGKLKNALLSGAEWERKLELVREEARNWRKRALDAEEKLDMLKSIIK